MRSQRPFQFDVLRSFSCLAHSNRSSSLLSSSFFLPPRPRLFHRFPFHRPPASLRSPFIPFLLSNSRLSLSLSPLSDLCPIQILFRLLSTFRQIIRPFLEKFPGIRPDSTANPLTSQPKIEDHFHFAPYLFFSE